MPSADPSPGAPAALHPPAIEPHPGLDGRTVVLVGLMGVGKTTVGRALATALQLPFRDADVEIERAARRTVAEIFAERGEAEFRAGERRVIARLLTQEPAHVLATGGGAFIDPQTRALARERALCVWLRTDLEVLARRVSRRNTRPLLHGRDPLEVLSGLAEQRYPFYREAHVTVETGDASLGASLASVLSALNAHVAGETEQR
jgi:shikimate kinase